MYKIFNIIINGFILGIVLQMNHGAKTIDFSVQPYYKQFMDIAKDCGVKLNDAELRIEVNYDKPNKPYYAVAYPLLNMVTVNHYKYQWLSSIQQEQVLLHELGHALLNLPHNDDDLNIMNTKGFIKTEDYISNYDYYVRKLFKVCNKKEKFQWISQYMRLQ